MLAIVWGSYREIRLRDQEAWAAGCYAAVSDLIYFFNFWFSNAKDAH